MHVKKSHPIALGAAIAQAMSSSSWWKALVASSSWSHASQCDLTYRLRPDTDADRHLYEALLAGKAGTWRETTLDDLVHAGHQGMLNWFSPVGAAETFGREVAWSDWIGTWWLNSNKVFARWN